MRHGSPRFATSGEAFSDERLRRDSERNERYGERDVSENMIHVSSFPRSSRILYIPRVGSATSKQNRTIQPRRIVIIRDQDDPIIRNYIFHACHVARRHGNTADRVISIERRPRLAAPCPSVSFHEAEEGGFNFSRLGHGGFVKLNLI
jgi:hypothetical protein